MKVLDSFAKVNLTLRITGKFENGYHKLCSVFYRIGPAETLTIKAGIEDNVRVRLNGVPLRMEGRNLVLKALDAARKKLGIDIPPLDMLLEKSVPPGTGMGAGSGNAAALLTFLESEYPGALSAASSVGADVPFFCGRHLLTLSSGIGDVLKPLEFKGGEPPVTVCVIPPFRTSTPGMYNAFDAAHPSFRSISQAEAEKEAQSILQKISVGEHVGLLPNDFSEILIPMHPEYAGIFAAMQEMGAYAWGISGSGSSAFGLWNRKTFCGVNRKIPFADEVLIF